MADDKKNIPEAASPAEAPAPAVENAVVPEQPAPEPALTDAEAVMLEHEGQAVDTMKAYFYCRVAHDDSFSLERQAKELRRYAEQAGYTIVGAAAEHGSGMTLDRPALQEVIEAVLAGKVDVVLISSLDRIGRDWGMTKQYIALLTEHKVKLLCLRERVSSDISGVSPFST